MFTIYGAIGVLMLSLLVAIVATVCADFNAEGY
jgi:hypothetical protein